MPKIVDTTGRTWTYGCEHELADWDTRKGWDGFGRDPEPNICNTNGIAADPRLISYKFGGEINTPPTSTPDEQGLLLEKFLNQHPNADANWRCGLHVHIRVPGLKDSLKHLQRLQQYITENVAVYPLVDPLPKPDKSSHPDPEELKAAMRRFNWMRMSHFTKIGEDRVAKQSAASSIQEFFEREVPRSRDNKPLWHAQPRAAINLRQLLQTDTIEFRHFPATLSGQETITAVEWCRDYLLAAFDQTPAVGVYRSRYSRRKFPTLSTIYVHWQELRWLATTISKNKRDVIEANIKRILQEDAWPPEGTVATSSRDRLLHSGNQLTKKPGR